MTGIGKWCLGVVALAILIATGCAGAYSMEDRLDLRVDQFNDTVRWGRYFTAANFVHADIREEWLADHRGWDRDVRIAEYEVIDSTPDLEASNTYVVRVVISWYRMSEGMVQTTMLAQRWRREERTWQLVSEEVEEGTPL